MTKVTFYQNSENQCVGFTSEDHAGYAQEGEDIVCAGISALVINTVNSIEAFTEDEFTVDVDEASARIHFMIKNKPSKESLLLLNSLILGLQRMEDEQYTEFIDIGSGQVEEYCHLNNRFDEKIRLQNQTSYIKKQIHRLLSHKKYPSKAH